MIHLSLLKRPELEDLGLSGNTYKNLRKYYFTETDKKMEGTSNQMLETCCINV